MTVSYTKKVSDCKGFGSFWRLLFRWRGSLYKLVWPDTLVYCFLYFVCSMVYRFGLDDEQRKVFEQLSQYCDYFRNLIPISFVLGFYVSVVVQRWWEQYLSIPWPDDFALLCTAYVRGTGERARSIRATLIRYVNLTCALTFAAISPLMLRKFPGYKELLEAGYLTPHEQRVLETQKSRSSVPLVTLPLMWCCRVIEGARALGDIRDDLGVRLLMSEVTKLRDQAGMLIRWTDMSIPLVYTQVVTMAVYSFFFFSVLGRQFLDPHKGYDNRTIDFYVPIFTLLQFFFYMGWLKVAESLVNPFGEDDDDFELDRILERHMKISYLLGDVTPTEDPLRSSQDDHAWEKLCPGVLAVPPDPGFLNDLCKFDLTRANQQGGHRNDPAGHRTDNAGHTGDFAGHTGHREHAGHTGDFAGHRGSHPGHREHTGHTGDFAGHTGDHAGHRGSHPGHRGGHGGRRGSGVSEQDTMVIALDLPSSQDRLDLIWDQMDLTPRRDNCLGRSTPVCPTPATAPTTPTTTPTSSHLPIFPSTEILGEDLSRANLPPSRENVSRRGSRDVVRMEGVVNPMYIKD